jgi:hypothetical protein
VRNRELIEHTRHDEVDESSIAAGDRRSPATAAGSPRRRARASACSRGGSRTAASRAGPARAAPLLQHDVGGALDQVVGEAAAIAPSAPIVHGQIAIASAGFEPEAIGAIQSSRPNTSSCRRARRSARRAARRLARLRRQREIAFLLRDDLRGRRVDENTRHCGREQALEQPQPYGMPDAPVKASVIVRASVELAVTHLHLVAR